MKIRYANIHDHLISAARRGDLPAFHRHLLSLETPLSHDSETYQTIIGDIFPEVLKLCSSKDTKAAKLTALQRNKILIFASMLIMMKKSDTSEIFFEKFMKGEGRSLLAYKEVFLANLQDAITRDTSGLAYQIINPKTLEYSLLDHFFSSQRIYKGKRLLKKIGRPTKSAKNLRDFLSKRPKLKPKPAVATASKDTHAKKTTATMTEDETEETGIADILQGQVNELVYNPFVEALPLTDMRTMREVSKTVGGPIDPTYKAAQRWINRVFTSLELSLKEELSCIVTKDSVLEFHTAKDEETIRKFFNNFGVVIEAVPFGNKSEKLYRVNLTQLLLSLKSDNPFIQTFDDAYEKANRFNQFFGVYQTKPTSHAKVHVDSDTGEVKFRVKHTNSPYQIFLSTSIGLRPIPREHWPMIFGMPIMPKIVDYRWEDFSSIINRFEPTDELRNDIMGTLSEASITVGMDVELTLIVADRHYFREQYLSLAIKEIPGKKEQYRQAIQYLKENGHEFLMSTDSSATLKPKAMQDIDRAEESTRNLKTSQFLITSLMALYGGERFDADKERLINPSEELLAMLEQVLGKPIEITARGVYKLSIDDIVTHSKSLHKILSDYNFTHKEIADIYSKSGCISDESIIKTSTGIVFPVKLDLSASEDFKFYKSLVRYKNVHIQIDNEKTFGQEETFQQHIKVITEAFSPGSIIEMIASTSRTVIHSPSRELIALLQGYLSHEIELDDHGNLKFDNQAKAEIVYAVDTTLRQLMKIKNIMVRILTYSDNKIDSNSLVRLINYKGQLALEVDNSVRDQLIPFRTHRSLHKPLNVIQSDDINLSKLHSIEVLYALLNETLHGKIRIEFNFEGIAIHAETPVDANKIHAYIKNKFLFRDPAELHDSQIFLNWLHISKITHSLLDGYIDLMELKERLNQQFIDEGLPLDIKVTIDEGYPRRTIGGPTVLRPVLHIYDGEIEIAALNAKTSSSSRPSFMKGRKMSWMTRQLRDIRTAEHSSFAKTIGLESSKFPLKDAAKTLTKMIQLKRDLDNLVEKIGGDIKTSILQTEYNSTGITISTDAASFYSHIEKWLKENNLDYTQAGLGIASKDKIELLVTFRHIAEAKPVISKGTEFIKR